MNSTHLIRDSFSFRFETMPVLARETTIRYLQQTIDLAKNSPPKPTNFRVGCVIVSFASQAEGEILSTGYTLELPGNTHAEQCALTKLEQSNSDLSSVLTAERNVVLYTSLEPCGLRLSGNLPCVQRIIATRSENPNSGIRKVIFGAKEPGTFVKDSQSCKLLTEAGIEWEYLPDLEEEILRVAMEGHEQKKADAITDTTKDKNDKLTEKSTDAEEKSRAAAEAAPRNPKKRMMEVPPPE